MKRSPITPPAICSLCTHSHPVFPGTFAWRPASTWSRREDKTLFETAFGALRALPSPHLQGILVGVRVGVNCFRFATLPHSSLPSTLAPTEGLVVTGAMQNFRNPTRFTFFARDYGGTTIPKWSEGKKRSLEEATFFSRSTPVRGKEEHSFREKKCRTLW